MSARSAVTFFLKNERREQARNVRVEKVRKTKDSLHAFLMNIKRDVKRAIITLHFQQLHVC